MDGVEGYILLIQFNLITTLHTSIKKFILERQNSIRS